MSEQTRPVGSFPSTNQPIKYYAECKEGYSANSLGLDIHAEAEERKEITRGGKAKWHLVYEFRDHRQMDHADKSKFNNNIAFTVWISRDGGQTISRWVFTEQGKRQIRKRSLSKFLTSGRNLALPGRPKRHFK